MRAFSEGGERNSEEGENEMSAQVFVGSLKKNEMY